MRKSHYTKEQLQEAVKKSQCVADVCRVLTNRVKIHGGIHSHIKTLLYRHQIDTSHFLTRSELARQRIRSEGHKRKPNELLVLNRKFIAHASQIRRALLEIGREYRCEHCSNDGQWLKQTLVLEVDHINGVKQDDRPENLRFLCPNCHSQTRNYRNRKSKA